MAIPAFILSALAAALIMVAPATAQEPEPADVESIDAIMAAVYDVISGPAGEARDWPRFRSLFVDGARLMPVGRVQGGSVQTRVLSPEEYADRNAPALERNGFFEREIGRVTERYGRIAHLFSTYESRRSAEDAQPFARGINSFQLMYDGNRWWVVSIFWQAESPEFPIPARYLGTGSGAP